jgi:hypothetical protein
MPDEYSRYVLAHHVYYCPPTELGRQDDEETRLHLAFWYAERKAQRA